MRDTTLLALAHIRILPNSRVLDIGCGTGQLLRALTPATGARSVVGLDLTLPMLRVARAKLGPDAHLVGGEAGRVPFADGTFTIVSCLSVLQYVPSREQALAEMYRILTPHGRLIMVEWRGDHPFCRALRVGLRLSRQAPVALVSAQTLHRLAEDAGFARICINHKRVAAVWPVMLMVAGKR